MLGREIEVGVQEVVLIGHNISWLPGRPERLTWPVIFLPAVNTAPPEVSVPGLTSTRYCAQWSIADNNPVNITCPICLQFFFIGVVSWPVIRPRQEQDSFVVPSW